jgi:hypothetical protein
MKQSSHAASERFVWYDHERELAYRLNQGKRVEPPRTVANNASYITQVPPP